MLSLLDEATTAGARLSKACGIIGVSPRTIERWRRQDGDGDGRCGPETTPANKLSSEEREKVIAVATSPEFRDQSPKQIVPTLADQDTYVASESTFYRVLREEKMMKHRASSQPPRNRPRALTASGPNQVYSWDITYLPGPIRGAFFYLYLFMDVYSRKIVGWRVEEEESMEHASDLISRVCYIEDIEPDQLVLHSDNGGPMKGATMVATLQTLGVMASFSRPHVSNDNPYSESLFGTMKYRPAYPRKAFEGLEEARGWVKTFVDWYNHEHLHSGIRFVTPADRHAGLDSEVLKKRKEVYKAARERHPARWSGPTRNWTPVGTVELNPEPGHAVKASSIKEAA